jgi:large subunit ribosomal protein L15
MQLHEIGLKKKRAQRIGRGGKRGTTAGRGTKGQHSRAGRRIRPAERDLILRIPKLRGFRNKPKREKPIAIQLGTLAQKLKSRVSGAKGIAVGKILLLEAGLISRRYRGEVKILADGAVHFPLHVKGLRVSRGAREKIERAGGSVANP